MRVVAGSARGRRLVTPAGDNTRPTSDRVREALFNTLTSLDVLADSTVLDLFAGSGALGIEALSRGAAHATFVERDRKALGAIRTNLEATGFAGQAEVLPLDAMRVVHDAADTGRSWDLALLDPPYAFDDWDDLLAALPATWVVAESDRELTPPAPWEVVRRKAYGGTVVFVARREPELPAASAIPAGETP